MPPDICRAARAGFGLRRLQAMRQCAIFPALLALGFTVVAAQRTEFLDPGNKFVIPASTPSSTETYAGSLPGLKTEEWTIEVPENYTDPDILLTLTTTDTTARLVLHCNPAYGSFVNNESSNATWVSALVTPVNKIYISKNHPYNTRFYPLARKNGYGIAFNCSVVNFDANTTANYTLVATIFESNDTLVESERDVLSSLFERCCAVADDACLAWKNSSSPGDVRGRSVFTNFCSFPNQICTPAGNLYRLDLRRMNLTCSWPSDLLLQFPQLSYLSLGLNPSLVGTTGDVFRTIANMSSLQVFNLSGNTGIVGSLDARAANQSLCSAVRQGSLLWLEMTSMGLTGNLSNCLYSQGSSLVFLILEGNQLRGRIENTIANDSALSHLDLGSNFLSGPLPPSLANARNLAYLNVGDNLMTGPIPRGIGEIRSLSSLNINDNSFTGPIPDSIGTAPNLWYFRARFNSLTALPAAWMNASFNASALPLLWVDVYGNSINGSFPLGLIYAPRLALFRLSENELSGPLPDKDSMLPSLQYFSVSYNKFNGSIPAAWGQTGLFSMRAPNTNAAGFPLELPISPTFDLSFNNFSGRLPDFLADEVLPDWASRFTFSTGISFRNNTVTETCGNPRFSIINTNNRLCLPARNAPAPAPRGGRSGMTAPGPTL